MGTRPVPYTPPGITIWWTGPHAVQFRAKQVAPHRPRKVYKNHSFRIWCTARHVPLAPMNLFVWLRIAVLM